MADAHVSIIIPMYNAAKYISDTLESVGGQTYRDWELIIVDDGSTDSSAEIVREFIGRHPHAARLLFHPGRENRGTSASRNLGWRHAKGELVCFLDADDVWNHDFLDFYTDVFSTHPEISMAYGPALLWHMNGGRSKDKLQRLGIRAERTVDCRTLMKLFLSGDGDTPSPSGVVLKHKILSAVGGWEESFRDMYDDQVLYSKLLSSGISVYVTDRCLYRYRQHDESICTKAGRENRNAYSSAKYLEWLKHYLMERGLLSEDLRLMITEQLWYARRHRENELLSSDRWFVRKLSSLGSFITLLRQQKDASLMIRLGGRIIGQQALHAVRRRMDDRL